MTTSTGPLPAVRFTPADERLVLLDKMGARQGERFIRYRFPTADAVIDPVRGVLFIVCDPEPDPADWSAVAGLIRAVGFAGNDRFPRRDPGEPEQDPVSGVYAWRLEYVDACAWCDSRGCLDGCPLCGRQC
jgi:hypothetical protein